MSKIVSSVMMVAGTSIGAAMIAMPISAAKIGFIASIVLMVVIAWVMYYVSHTILSIYKATNSDATLAKIAGQVLGVPFQVICSVATLALLYSLLVAYISGLSGLVSEIISIDHNIIVLLVVIILFISLGISHKIFDHYNKAAFSLKVLFMCVMTAVLLPDVSIENLVISSTVEPNLLSILSIMSVFVTSFGFHASIPFIYKFVNRDEDMYEKAIKYGVIITLLIYITWLSLTFGVIKYQNLIKNDQDLHSFISQMNTGSNILSKAINFFAMLAILTSLFGVATGLYDFIEEFYRDKLQVENRWLASGTTFGLPFVFCMISKNLFIKALSFAGCALTIIAIIIPIFIKFKLNNNVKSGLLIFCLFIGALTILSEILIAFHLID